MHHMIIIVYYITLHKGCCINTGDSDIKKKLLLHYLRSFVKPFIFSPPLSSPAISCLITSCLYTPSCATSSLCVPCSTTHPFSITITCTKDIDREAPIIYSGTSDKRPSERGKKEAPIIFSSEERTTSQ